MAELQAIIDAIVVIQVTITPPTGEKDIAVATDELPTDLTLFPMFLNVETRTGLEYGVNLRVQRHEIDMHLVFGTAEKKYSMRSRRAWVEAVMAAFIDNVTLGGTVTQAMITEVTYDTPLQWNETAYMAATFRLAAEVKSAAAFTV